MKELLKIAVLAVITLLAANQVLAQEWTKEQTEVWKVVQDSWKAWQSGDADAIAPNFHEKYQGWSDEAPLPIGKKAVMDWYNSMKENMKVNYYNIEPARITVLKGAAVVNYYYEMSVSVTMGDEKSSEQVKGKNVEFYVYEAGKWLLLGDMMVHQEEEDD